MSDEISKLIADRKKRVGDRVSRIENTVRLIRQERTAQLQSFKLTFAQDVKLINTQLAELQVEMNHEMKIFNQELAEIRKELKAIQFDIEQPDQESL